MISNLKFLKVNLHWQIKGWHFDELLQLRKQLWEMDPFSNVGTKEIQQEIGDQIDTGLDPAQFLDLKYVLIDDTDFNGDLEFLKLCPCLEHLFICGISAAEKIKDLTPLAYLKNLKFLHLEHHNISVVSALKELINLEEIYLFENPLLNITGILNLKNLETVHFSEAEEEEVFELLQNSSGCEVHFINREYDTGFRACRLGNWAYMYSYIKDYTQVNTQIAPLLPLKFISSAPAEKLMKERLHRLSLSVLRANEVPETPSFIYSKDPVAVIGKMVYK
ncbi:hypothetical protein FK178_02715 [Antarcticibacterium arcticum]|uniref:Leucine-rich repeat domain-containing protein n=1 Tax=Antarcticibacterium arcticum TaxID=2585771 RepID=A0A5B8YGH2_9FLAO|nr:hypothetical protein [Antarcticibacterium arcticum]QED36691.1 hypothetical protein FK178_02715 [Antarcticibacterium arcticum]